MPNPGSMSKEQMRSLGEAIVANEGREGLTRDLGVMQDNPQVKKHYLNYLYQYQELLKLPALSEDDVTELRAGLDVIQAVLDKKDMPETEVRRAVCDLRLHYKAFRGRSKEDIERRQREIELMKLVKEELHGAGNHNKEAAGTGES